MAALLVIVGACGSSGPGASPPDDPPAIVPGVITSGSVEIDQTNIEYVAFVPDGFNPGDEAPLLLAFPPGGQTYQLTFDQVNATYAPQAQALGWVVISPVAPNGKLFFDGSEELVPGFLDWVETWVNPEGGAPHVVGLSNGGISTFRYAAQNPDRVQSMIAYPGFPQSGDDKDALEALVDVPIRIFVGGNDTPWIGPAEDAVAHLTELGGDARVHIFDGEGHVILAARDGALIFELLQSFRS